MDERLAGAIEATRAGDTKLAQLQLTRLLKENPNHVQGWYLLSMLVDSGEKKALFLQKVLKLDPEHAKAREQLAAIGTTMADKTAVPAPPPVEEIPTPPPIVEEAETGKQSYVPAVSELPSWLQEDDTGNYLEEPPTQFSIPLPESKLGEKPDLPPLAEEEDLAETPVPAEFAAPDLPAQPSEAPLPPVPAAKTTPKPKKEPASLQTRTLNLAILVLIVLALLISFLLIRELVF